MSEKKYTLREIEDLIKKDTELHKNLLKSIRKSIIAFTKDHPESNLNNSNCWPSIAKEYVVKWQHAFIMNGKEIIRRIIKMQDIHISVIFENVPDDVDPAIVENWIFDTIMDGANWEELENKIGYEFPPPYIGLF